MKRHFSLAHQAVWTAVASFLLQPAFVFAEQGALPPAANSSPPKAPKIVDVELDDQGRLTGQITSPTGQPMAETPILIDNGRQRRVEQTGPDGQFAFQKTAGGVYRIEAAGQTHTCRVWKAGTAPPGAQRGLFLLQNGEFALGQNCGSPVAAGFAGAREALANPLIFGGIVAAAIAIPVAIHNADDDDGPAS